MPVKFIHTADWQIGKPFAWVSDAASRVELQLKRIQVLERIVNEVREHNASFVVVAGDLFDTSSPLNKSVSDVCTVIGRMKVPVFVIPGNHDHGGPLGLWEKAFFQKERDELAPNLRILLKAEPVVLENAVLLPCPLLKRHDRNDPAAWLRNRSEVFTELPADRPRIVIAHGSVQDFGAVPDEDEDLLSDSVNRLDLDKLPVDDIDYVALGDWHGTKPVNSKAWYSGTPELDRFNKGGDYDPGNILLVESARGGVSKVRKINVAGTRWHEFDFFLSHDDDVRRLENEVDSVVAEDMGRNLVKLRLSGATGMDGFADLERLFEKWDSRFLCLRLENKVVMQPSHDELERLTQQSENPLTAQVAQKLSHLIQAGGEASEVARLALRQLYIASKNAKRIP